MESNKMTTNETDTLMKELSRAVIESSLVALDEGDESEFEQNCTHCFACEDEDSGMVLHEKSCIVSKALGVLSSIGEDDPFHKIQE